MLVVDEEARDYLFVLLDHIRHWIPLDSCFRLERDESGQPILHLSHEADGDDSSDHDGHTVLVWKPEQFAGHVDCTLEVEDADDDVDEHVLVLASVQQAGLRTETVVEVEERVHRILTEII